MFETIVHQTLQNLKNDEEVEAFGPYPVEDIENAYLGEGHYFWDNHIELAHWWGEYHCNNNYIICEGELRVNKKLFLDLVGDRAQHIRFMYLLDKFNLQDMVIGKAIGVLRDLDKINVGIFPYKVIRAVDNKYKEKFKQKQYRFSNHPHRKGFTIFAPMFLICLIDKDELLLPSYKVIYPD